MCGGGMHTRENWLKNICEMSQSKCWNGIGSRVVCLTIEMAIAKCHCYLVSTLITISCFTVHNAYCTRLVLTQNYLALQTIWTAWLYIYDDDTPVARLNVRLTAVVMKNAIFISFALKVVAILSVETRFGVRYIWTNCECIKRHRAHIINW